MAPRTATPSQADAGATPADVRMLLGIAVGSATTNDTDVLAADRLRAQIVDNLTRLAPADTFQIWRAVAILAADAPGAAAAVRETVAQRSRRKS